MPESLRSFTVTPEEDFVGGLLVGGGSFWLGEEEKEGGEAVRSSGSVVRRVGEEFRRFVKFAMRPRARIAFPVF